MKSVLCSITGIVGSAIAFLFGGWDSSLITLLIFMLADYLTGLIVAGVFHKSKKTETGNLDSRIGWKGLCKKIVTLILVVVAHRLDIQMGTTFIKDAVCIAFITNEALSLIENAGLMGVPIPKAIREAIAVLHNGNEQSKNG